MRQSVIKIGINNFLNDIKFGEEYYLLYNNILNESIISTEELFFFIILQTCLQTKFSGYFDELYIDIIKRKHEYVKEMLSNFKTAAVDPPTYYNRIKKCCCLCGKMTEKEIMFHRKISLLNFDIAFNEYFDLKNNYKKMNFISKCERIYNDSVMFKLDEKVNLRFKQKSERRVRFCIS